MVERVLHIAASGSLMCNEMVCPVLVKMKKIWRITTDQKNLPARLLKGFGRMNHTSAIHEGEGRWKLWRYGSTED
jgi:hypothetical protein